MWKVLEKFNFGSSFISAIKCMYNDISSTIRNRGWLSDFFPLKKGIRQGCPISALLFILTVEIMAVKIRQAQDVEGIKVKTHSNETVDIKISQVADDTTLFVSDLTSMENAFKLIQDFCSNSSLNLNVKKCEGLWIGSYVDRQDTPLGISWPKTPIKSLGIYFYNSSLHHECELLNWEKKN